MIAIEHNRDDTVVCRASGTLTKADYSAALPELENALGKSKKPLRLMVLLEDFHGWEMGALWEELRFDVKHGSDFGRVAVVGEKKWEEWGTRLSAPFFGSEVRYFDRDDKPAARAWLMEKDTAAA